MLKLKPELVVQAIRPFHRPSRHKVMLPLAFLPLGHLLLVGLQRNKRRLLRFLHVDIEMSCLKP